MPMTPFLRLRRCHAVLLLSGAAMVPVGWMQASRAVADGPAARQTIDFNAQIRPILSENCFACHGPDEKQRKGKLRFDRIDAALAQRPDGTFVIKAGKSADSELVTRVTSTDPEVQMPPPKSNKKLTPQQVELLRQWIDEGAPSSRHWSLIAPVRPPIPKVSNASWPRNAIDSFILARLDKEGLQPSAEAAKTTLIRRVTLDLTGLPPSPAEVDAFVADSAPDAYEKVVIRLLQSPHFGEHMARYWLDAARYGDTHGLHLDNYRELWPYRDWVVRAFNSNKPFDQFIMEQLAGDLLPNPTLDQLIATGYNRCHVSTSEGGSIDEEVYVRNVVDQVDTNGIVFLGLTLGCCRCHDHKYDPVKMKDYYQLFAFFNNIDGKPLDGNSAQWPPIAKIPSAEQARQMDGLQARSAALKQTIGAELAKAAYDDKLDADAGEYVQRSDYVWIDDELPPGAQPSVDNAVNRPWEFVSKPDHPALSGARAVRLAATGLAQVVFEKASPALKVGEGDSLFAHVFIDPLQPPKAIMLQWNDGNWGHRAYWGENVIDWGKDGTPERVHVGPLPTTGKWVRIEVEAAKVGLKPGTTINGCSFTQHGGTAWWDKAGIETWTPQEGQKFDSLTAWVRAQKVVKGAGLPKPIQDILGVERAKRNDAQKKQLREYFVENVWPPARGVFDPILKQLAEVEKERDLLDKKIPTTLVVKESQQIKPAYILKRGEYDQKGDKVDRDTPAALPPFPADAPRNRLGFAQWLVRPDQPLTARVAVNRFWQQLFGTGIVKTTEDFGSQGELPKHPELLDWLATEFVREGWDVKRFLKLLVMSATYRQDSRTTRDRLAADPANRLLARGPRFRLDAETLRDQALFAGGLAVEHIGGPGVKPPQPSGIWEAVGYVGSNTARFTADTGCEKVHRRSLYTFWKRTAPPPQMNSFDAPSREACCVRRERTNTPLQALLLLNETQYVECSRALAERAMREGGPTPEVRIRYMFRLATARSPDAREVAELLAAYQDFAATYAKDPEGAKKLIAVGETKPDPSLSPGELAAWTMEANLILNLDEVLNKG